MVIPFLFFAFCYFVSLQLHRLFFFSVAKGEVQSILVGYPLFYDFDINRMFRFYYGEFLLVPLFALFLFYNLRPLLLKKAETRVAASESNTWPFLRLFVVGFFASRLFLTPAVSAWPFCAWAGVGYALCVWGVTRNKAQWMAAINAVIAPLAVLAVVRLSASSFAVVDGQKIAVPWFPMLVGIAVWGGLEAFAVLRVWRFRADLARTQELEKSLLVWILCPLALYFPCAVEAPGVRDFFHSGELVVPAYRVLQGAFPWRDLLFVHGLMEDCFQFLPGMKYFGGFWGGEMGQRVWLVPLTLACTGFLYGQLFKSNPAFLCVALILALSPLKQIGPPVVARFCLVPLTLISCLCFLRHASVWRAGAFSLLAVGGVFVVAESFFFGLAYAAIVLLADVQEGKGYRRSKLFAGFSVLFILVGYAYLYAQGALKPFLEFHLKTASGHRFTGGIPIEPIESTFVLFNMLTVAAAMVFGIVCWRRRQKLTPEELTMGAVALFAMAYYQKYLSRADLPHFYIYWAPVIVLFYYVTYRFLNAVDGLLRPKLPRWAPAHAVSLVLCCLLIGARFSRVRAEFDRSRQSVTVHSLAFDPSLGPVAADAKTIETMKTLREFFQTAGEGTVFDFTNHPLLFHYLLRLRPPTRFPYTSLAIHPVLQKQLIEELENSKPRFVVYSKLPPRNLDGWDEIPNSVRHYLVSEYLLRNYTAGKWVAGFLILERKTLVKKAPRDPAIFTASHSCDWGYVVENWGTPDASEKTAGQPLSSSIPVPDEYRAGPAVLEIGIAKPAKDTLSIQTPSGKISWKTKPGPSRRYRIALGSCPQWYSARLDKIAIAHSEPADIVSIRWLQTLRE